MDIVIIFLWALRKNVAWRKKIWVRVRALCSRADVTCRQLRCSMWESRGQKWGKGGGMRPLTDAHVWCPEPGPLSLPPQEGEAGLTARQRESQVPTQWESQRRRRQDGSKGRRGHGPRTAGSPRQRKGRGTGSPRDSRPNQASGALTFAQ